MERRESEEKSRISSFGVNENPLGRKSVGATALMDEEKSSFSNNRKDAKRYGG